MRFRFRLERALHFARLRETKQKSRIAAATVRIRDFENRLVGMRETLHSMLSADGGRLQLARTPWLEAKIGADSAATKLLETQIVSERNGLETLKTGLARLMRRTKALESLREKRLLDFRLEQSRDQQSRLDESFRLLRTAQSMNEGEPGDE